MNTKTMLAAASLLLTFATTSYAHEPTNVQFYDGSREELRALCEGPGATLTERADRTVCLDTVNRISRVCLDEIGCYALSDEDLLATGGIAPRD
jgi:hypothetical protein